jgi:hypothetical protein
MYVVSERSENLAQAKPGGGARPRIEELKCPAAMVDRDPGGKEQTCRRRSPISSAHTPASNKSNCEPGRPNDRVSTRPAATMRAAAPAVNTTDGATSL